MPFKHPFLTTLAFAAWLMFAVAEFFAALPWNIFAWVCGAICEALED